MIKRPARLDIVDMPRDAQRSLGTLRQALCASFNYCRKYPAKMATLKAVMKYVYTRITEWEKEQAAYEASLLEAPKAPEKAPKAEAAKLPNSDKKEAPAAN